MRRLDNLTVVARHRHQDTSGSVSLSIAPSHIRITSGSAISNHGELSTERPGESPMADTDAQSPEVIHLGRDRELTENTVAAGYDYAVSRCLSFRYEAHSLAYLCRIAFCSSPRFLSAFQCTVRHDRNHDQNIRLPSSHQPHGNQSRRPRIAEGNTSNREHPSSL
jgi:hypothetical protein